MDQPPTPTSAASEALARISRRIEEDEAAAYAEFVKQMQGSEDRRGPILWFLGQKFEIHAYYHSFLVTDYEAIKGWYEPDLQNRRNCVIQEAEEITCNWRAAVAQEFREKLATHLLGRLHYWKAEVMKRARTFDVKESGADESGATEGLRKNEHSETPEILAVEQPATPKHESIPDHPENAPELQPDPVAAERTTLLNAFKTKARGQGLKVTDKDIAQAANPGKWNDRTIVAWWKRNDDKSTPGHDKKIRAILNRDPVLIWPKP